MAKLIRKNQKEEFKIRFKFKEGMSEEEGNRILFQVFDALLLAPAKKEQKIYEPNIMKFPLISLSAGVMSKKFPPTIK